MGKLRCKLRLSSEIAKAETIVFDSAVKRKTSEFIVIRFKLISNRAFNRETFFSLSAALPSDPYRSMANN